MTPVISLNHSPYSILVHTTPCAGKPDAQPCTFAVWQQVPVPYPEVGGAWAGFEEVFHTVHYLSDVYGDERLPARYRFALLRSDLVEPRGDRTDFAGYSGNPGDLIYRKQPVGELTGDIDLSRPGELVLWGRSGGLRTWLSKLFDDMLVRAVKDNQDKLYSDAVCELKRRFSERLCKFDDSRKRLSATAERLIATLLKNMPRQGAKS